MIADQHTWHACIKVCEFDSIAVTPLEAVQSFGVTQANPEIFLRPKTDQANEESVLIPKGRQNIEIL